MIHAVVLAHPKADSFNAAIAGRVIATLERFGHQTVLRDLYAMDFDPRLHAAELSTSPDFKPDADVVRERELLKDVGGFIFVYPLWFNGPPAILKGYVDRVFGLGFGSSPHLGGAEPLLNGRTLLSFSTSGAPDRWVHSTGALRALMSVFDLHLAGVCGLQVIGHHHYGEIVPGITREAGDEVLAEVEAVVRKLFTQGDSRDAQSG